jgi:bifunctional ADP-heptose synthase (sugar kinase/adenylyltransferase)
VLVSGPIDIVGAGDSTMAGIVTSLCAGAAPGEAALVGNLVASITIQQIGTTGTASRQQALERFREFTQSGRAFNRSDGEPSSSRPHSEVQGEQAAPRA